MAGEIEGKALYRQSKAAFQDRSRQFGNWNPKESNENAKKYRKK